MAFSLNATMQVVKTHLEGLNLFYEVLIGRLAGPVGEGPIAAIHGESIQVAEVTSHAIELHVLNVRLFQATHIGTDENLELDGWTLVSSLMALLYADFTLGGNVRNIDVGGQYGVPLSAARDEEELAQTPYYVADITLPLVVDDTTTLAG